MKWNIVADTSCDLYGLEEKWDNIEFSTVPFVISVGDRDFVDDENLDVDGMIDYMDECEEGSHTSCPSPQTWHEQFEKEGNVIAITISERLSGSYNSACAAKNMILETEADKNIAVINSCSTGPEMVLIIRKLCKLISEGYEFDAVMEKINDYMKHSHIVYALCSFNNLVKNGRMGKIAGFVANKLGFWGIGIATPEGTIDVKHKVRGKKKVIENIIRDMKERGEHIESVVISNCQNMEIAEKMKQAIISEWNKADVKIVAVRGLCAYYAEKGGFLVGYR